MEEGKNYVSKCELKNINRTQNHRSNLEKKIHVLYTSVYPKPGGCGCYVRKGNSRIYFTKRICHKVIKNIYIVKRFANLFRHRRQVKIVLPTMYNRNPFNAS